MGSPFEGVGRRSNARDATSAPAAAHRAFPRYPSPRAPDLATRPAQGPQTAHHSPGGARGPGRKYEREQHRLLVEDVAEARAVAEAAELDAERRAVGAVLGAGDVADIGRPPARV